MHQNESFPLILPATHSPEKTTLQHSSAHNQASFKQKQLQNKSSEHRQVLEVGHFDSERPSQAQKKSKSKVSQKKLKSPANNQKQNNAKLSEIIKKKKELDEQIARLKYEEEKEKKIIHKGFDRNMRSYITEEEKLRIKKALEEKRKFQMLTNMKLKQIQQEIRQKQKSEEKELREKLDSIRSQKRKEALTHLQLLKLKQMERTKKIKEANKKFQETKLKTFLHQKMEEKWKSQLEESQLKNKKVLQSLRAKKQLSLEQLKKHQQEYKRFIEKDESQRKKNVSIQIIKKKQLQKKTLLKYQPSRFLKTVFDEQESKKKLQKSKTLQLFSNITKKSIFSQTIRQVNKDSFSKRQNLSPIKQVIDKVEQNDTASQNKSQKARSLSQVQLLKLGNNYMRQINSSLGHIDSQSSKGRKNQENKTKKQDDYLKELKEKRAKMEANPEVKQIRELKSLMKKQISMDQKWYRAKLITNRLQQRTDLDTEMLLKSLATKIEIINQFKGH